MKPRHHGGAWLPAGGDGAAWHSEGDAPSFAIWLDYLGLRQREPDRVPSMSRPSLHLVKVHRDNVPPAVIAAYCRAWRNH